MMHLEAMDRRTQASVVQVAKQLRQDAPRLAQEMSVAYREQVEQYAAMSREEMQDVVDNTAAIIKEFFAALEMRRIPDARDVMDLEDRGRTRLEMNIHLESMLHVYRIAGCHTFNAIVKEVEPGAEVLGYIGARWFDYIDQAASRASAGYLRASQERIRTRGAFREAIVQALLAAGNAAEVAAVAGEFSFSLAPTYAPVLTAADHQSIRPDVLLNQSKAGSLAGFRGAFLVLLVPGETPTGLDLKRWYGPGPVAWGHPTPPGPALRTEVEQAERVLTAARARGVEGVLGPDDLLLDRLLAGDPQAVRVLEKCVLAPLQQHDRGGLLLSTLQTYLATGSAGETAKSEHAHMNTVVNRLRRVRELTGYDPRVPNDATVLVLAVRHATRNLE